MRLKKYIALAAALCLSVLSGCHGTLAPDTTAPAETESAAEGETKETEEPVAADAFALPESFDNSTAMQPLLLPSLERR